MTVETGPQPRDGGHGVTGALILVAMLVLAVQVSLVRQAAAQVDCRALAPSGDPSANLAAINTCLSTGDRTALLHPGTHLVDGTITVPADAVLGAVDPNDRPLVQLAANPSAVDVLVRIDGGAARVESLRLDAAARLNTSGCCNAVVSFANCDDSVLADSEVLNNPDGVGVYLICSRCDGNILLRNDIHHHHWGVIFVRFNDGPRYENTVDGGRIHQSACDAITFGAGDGTYRGGYGVVRGVEVFHNGGRCRNGIPGAGVYSEGNDAGGQIVHSEFYGNCGNNLDLVNSENLHVEGNRSYRPGFRHPETTLPSCQGLPIILFDVARSHVLGNEFRNDEANDVLGNMPSWRNLFSPAGGTPYSDLARGGDTTIAFLLAEQPGIAKQTVGNRIDGNTMSSACASPCIGVGYFATRGTGFCPNGTWSPQTTNYYTNNDPTGSNVGSQRGGGNWYAANSTCTAGSSPAPCNADDYQHPTSVNWARNDGFPHY